MIYLVCLIVSLNVVLLVEVVSKNVDEQKRAGSNIGYGLTFIFYLLQIIVIAAAIYGVAHFFNLE